MTYLARKFIRAFLPEIRMGTIVATKGAQSFQSFEQGSPRDTRELVNDFIPSEDAIRDSYVFEQVMQEGFAHAYMIALPPVVKIGLEVYSFVDYFMND